MAWNYSVSGPTIALNTHFPEELFGGNRRSYKSLMYVKCTVTLLHTLVYNVFDLLNYN